MYELKQVKTKLHNILENYLQNFENLHYDSFLCFKFNIFCNIHTN